MHSVALGDIGQPFPRSATLDGLCALIVGKLGLPTELHASSHGPFTAVACALANQIPLEFRYCGYGNGALVTARLALERLAFAVLVSSVKAEELTPPPDV